MKQVIAGIVLATVMTTAIAEGTRADKISYCYSVAEMAKVIAEYRERGRKLSEVLRILRESDGEGYEELALTIYEYPNVASKEVKKVFLELCLSNVRKNQSKEEKPFRGEF